MSIFAMDAGCGGLGERGRHDGNKEKNTEDMKSRLTAKEEEIMQIVWDNGDLLIREIVARLPEPRPNYNTVATQVKFLEDKGFLGRIPVANSFRYTALISEKQYRGITIGEVVTKYYGNSYRQLVSQFVEEDRMDLEELKDLIAQIELNRKNR